MEWTLGWQLALTGVIILAAAGYVGWSIVRAVVGRGKAGCGPACAKCTAPQPPAQPGRIQLPQLPSK